MEQHAIFDIEFEAGGIAFYAISNEQKVIDEIKQAFKNISEEEEQKLISTLNEMFAVEKPCGDVWKVLVNGKQLIFYLNGYQIEVTTA